MSQTDQLIELLSQQTPPAIPKPRPLLLFFAWLVGAFAYVALLLSFGTRPDLMLQLSQPLFASEVGVLIAMIVVSGLTAVFLASPDLYQKRWVMLLPLAALALFVMVLVAEYQSMPAPTPLPSTTMECSLCILLYALVPAAWLMVLVRRQATTHPRITGCLIVMAVTSIGALAVRLHEQTDSIPHLLTWHYVPMALASIAGMALGKVFFKW